jgi:selenide, water dikinase
MKYDLLNLVEQGGCSAKLSASELQKALDGLPKIKNENLLVDIETHDDAGVYKINDDYAIIQTTDFFPPVCSDAYDFGQIAAANALSDVYAMGGQVLTALNIVLFPAKLPMEILKEILRGGHDKVTESGGVIVGGHTIADDIPKYGLAVSGWIHPDNIITNSGAKPGDILLLTKPLGTGIAIAAKKIELGDIGTYNEAIETMKQLNMHASDIMIKHKVKCATDITGFGLLGHALKLAQGSEVSIKIYSQQVPSLNKTFELIEMGCIPGAAFRNLEFVEDECLFEKSVEYNSKMLLVDAQTSGGLLICSPPEAVEKIKKELIDKGYEQTSIIGEVIDKADNSVYIG